MNLYSAKEMTDLLERYDFFFKKNLGQNFLMNESIAARIADSSFETVLKDKKSLAIEIGPGAGSLTVQLAKRFDAVLALEIDPHLIGVLEESLKEHPNVKVVHTDALAFDFSTVLDDYPDHSISVCSNLPYYITSEIIMTLLEAGLPITSITVLIQKEAAVRLTSKPGTEQYGAITAAVGYYAASEKLFTVGPGNFIPRPKVDSAVLRLTPYPEPAVRVQDQKLFFKLIRAAFGNRRKTLSNALSSALKDSYSKEVILEVLAQAGIDPTRRGETLTLEEYAKISDTFTFRR